MRAVATHIVALAARQLGVADVYAQLRPLVAPVLYHDHVTLSDEKVTELCDIDMYTCESVYLSVSQIYSTLWVQELAAN